VSKQETYICNRQSDSTLS